LSNTEIFCCYFGVRILSSAEQKNLIFEQVADAIFKDGFVVLEDAVPDEVAHSLLDHLTTLEGAAFSQAGVGRGLMRERNSGVRRDRILWINEGTAAGSIWLAWTQELQSYLNQRLLLGLFSFESHYAVYGPGDFYKTHVDAFRGQGNRVLSLVTYLNKEWSADYGGELVIYHPDSEAELVRVAPRWRTLVVFLSEEFPHEVMTARFHRFSVAGWFRVNSSSSEKADPSS
jgi:SM-20-related protein